MNDNGAEWERDGDEREAAIELARPAPVARRSASKAKIHRSQPVDPVTKRRLSFSSESSAEVDVRAAEVRSIRRLMKYGGVTIDEAARRLGQGARRLMVAEVWDTYVRVRLISSWKKQAESMWAQHMAGPFGKLAVAELNVIRLMEWEGRQVAAGLKWKTIRLHFDLLKAACNLQIAARNLDELPWGTWTTAKISGEDEREACRNSDELELLLRATRDRDALGRGYADLTWRVLLFALLGLRQGEGGGLGWDHVFLDGAHPHVFIEFQVKEGWKARFDDRPRDAPKKGKTRRIALDAILVRAFVGLRAHLERWHMYRPDGPVFPLYRSGIGAWRHDPDTIDVANELRTSWIAAGLPNASRAVVHSLRHTFGTMGQASGDPIALQKAMGHSDAKTTRGYQHMMRRGLPGVSIGTEGMLPAGCVPLLPPAPPRDDARDGGVTGETVALVETVRTLAAVALVEPGRPSRAEQVRRSKAKARGRELVDLVAAFAAWTADGRPDDVPREVLDAARAAYHRGYTAKQRSEEALGIDPALARIRAATAGKMASRGVRANWGKTKKRMLEAELRAGKGPR